MGDAQDGYSAHRSDQRASCREQGTSAIGGVQGLDGARAFSPPGRRGFLGVFRAHRAFVGEQELARTSRVLLADQVLGGTRTWRGDIVDAQPRRWSRSPHRHARRLMSMSRKEIPACGWRRIGADQGEHHAACGLRRPGLGRRRHRRRRRAGERLQRREVGARVGLGEAGGTRTRRPWRIAGR